MSDSTSPGIAKLHGLHRNAKVAVVAGLVILFVFPFALIRLHRYLSTPVQNETIAVAKSEQLGIEPEVDADPLQFLDSEPQDPGNANDGLRPRPKPYMSSQEKAIRDRQILLLRQQGDAIRNSITELTKVQGATTQSLEQLLSNDDGKKLAAQPELIDQFVVVQDSFKSHATPAASLSAEADIMLAPLQQIESEPIQTHFESTLKELAEKVDAQLFAAQRTTRQLNVLLATSADIAGAQIPLSQAIDKRSIELEQQQVVDLSQAVEAARKAVVDQAADEAADGQRKITEAERAVEQVKEKKRLADLKAEQDAIAAAIAKAQLEREFQRDRPEINSLLRVFITEGMTQPGRLGEFQPADTRGKASLASIRATGALEPTVKGRNALFHSIRSAKGRDHGSFPVHSGTFSGPNPGPATMRAQELLAKYGQHMVEKKMLAE